MPTSNIKTNARVKFVSSLTVSSTTLSNQNHVRSTRILKKTNGDLMPLLLEENQE
jgi:hypothetical protein